MKIIRVVKSQVVILHTVVLTILMFSSMVGYVAGSIYCEEGVSLLFWKWYTVLIALIHDAQQACSCHSTVLILVCRKTCTVTAYWYTCTYNMLYSVSYVTQKRDDRLWVSVKFSPLTSTFPSQEQDSYSQYRSLNVVAMMMEAAWNAAMLVLLLQSI